MEMFYVHKYGQCLIVSKGSAVISHLEHLELKIIDWMTLKQLNGNWLCPVYDNGIEQIGEQMMKNRMLEIVSPIFSLGWEMCREQCCSFHNNVEVDMLIMQLVMPQQMNDVSRKTWSPYVRCVFTTCQPNTNDKT